MNWEQLVDSSHFEFGLQRSPLTKVEQIEKLQSTFEKDKGLFLEKWGRYLTPKQLDLFKPFSSYEVDFYLKKYTRKLDEKTRRNRRLYYMNHVMDPNYFSLDAIKERDPELYLEYVGRYESPISFSSPSLIERVLHDMDQVQYLAKIKNYKDKRDLIEFDSESEEEDQLEYPQQLIDIMKQRFLAGKEAFDYGLVDPVSDYDEAPSSGDDGWFESD